MGSAKSKPNSQLTAVAMSGLNIELEDTRDKYLKESGTDRLQFRLALLQSPTRPLLSPSPPTQHGPSQPYTCKPSCLYGRQMGDMESPFLFCLSGPCKGQPAPRRSLAGISYDQAVLSTSLRDA
jgi:hypothetical protein